MIITSDTTKYEEAKQFIETQKICGTDYGSGFIMNADFWIDNENAEGASENQGRTDTTPSTSETSDPAE